jgi:hypothetical protein
MKIKVYVIDFETPRWARRLVAFAAPAVVLFGLAAVVIAAPTQFTSGAPLTHEALQSLNTVTTNAGAKYSVGATLYCGSSTPPTNGQTTGGYKGAKALCEAACKSPTAHMCTGEEMVRSSQLGLIDPDGGAAWYSSGANAVAQVGVSFSSQRTYVYVVDDCAGWTSTSSNGASWATGQPNYSTCTSLQSILCCD